MQGNQGSMKQGRGQGEGEFVPAFVRTGEPVPVGNAVAGTTWASSAFDLAQGLDVTVFEARISPEELDELYR